MSPAVSLTTPLPRNYLSHTLQYQVNNNGTYTYYTTFDAALAAAENGAEIVKVARALVRSTTPSPLTPPTAAR